MNKIKQILFFPVNFISGRIRKTTAIAQDLKTGEGAIVEIGGKKGAAYKNVDGTIITLSPVCRHLGCIVGWNSTDKTWDCPCHGSRYAANGKVIQGPAKSNLKEVHL